MNEEWKKLTFEQKLQWLKKLDQAKALFELTDDEIAGMKKMASVRPSLKPDKGLEKRSAAPDKRSLREASRDFDPDLIFAELIDNPIDRYLKDTHAPGTGLKIEISFDPALNACVFEDNAGGFSFETLVNFFKPGGTENNALTHSIGSYAWGAKKARAALSESVELVSRPKDQPACMATLKPGWDDDDHDWNVLVGIEGANFTLDQDSQIAEGHTRLIFKDLKPLIQNHTDPYSLAILRRNLGEVYGLIIAKHQDSPPLNLELLVQGDPVSATVGYKWTAFEGLGYDLRPHRYEFTRKVTLPFVHDVAQQQQDIGIVLEIGVKTTTGCATEGISKSDYFDPSDDWGIDVYGNGRLIQRNVRSQLAITNDLIRGNNAAKLVKGRLILKGSSYVIPWDTHKSRIADAHPSLKSINDAIGLIVQEYFKSAAKAAGRGTDLDGAVRLFHKSAWDGKWESPSPTGAAVSLVYQEPSPAPSVAEAPPEPTPVDAPTASQATSGEGPPPEPGVSAPAVPVGTSSAPPVTAPPQPLSLPLPKVPAKTAASQSRRNRHVKFTVTEAEHQNLVRWRKCRASELNEKIKETVLNLVQAAGAQPTTTPATPTTAVTSVEGFTELRKKVKDLGIIAKLQAKNLSTVQMVQAAGQQGLAEAGLTEKEIALVLQRVGNE